MKLVEKKKYGRKAALRILVIRLSAMGDVAMTIPVIHAFTVACPQIKLSVLSQKKFAPFFVCDRLHFIGIDLKHYRGLKGLYSLFKVLQKENFDIVLDLHDVLRSNILRFFFRIMGRKVFVIDKGRKDKRALTRQKNKILKPLSATVERYTEVFKRAGFNIEPSIEKWRIHFADRNDNIASIFPTKENTVRIGIAPFAAHEGKIYPLNKMAQVVDYLSSKGFNIYLFGGKGKERVLLQEWESRFPQCVSMAEKFTLDEELQIISKLDLMISMDSANMHLASLVGVPALSIWGATHPYAGFLGWEQSSENIIQLDLPCRPCSVYGNKKCFRKDKPYACMQDIAPSTVIEKAMSILKMKNEK
jgi:ADP-heptose:LPS heptosyltransferase